MKHPLPVALGGAAVVVAVVAALLPSPSRPPSGRNAPPLEEDSAALPAPLAPDDRPAFLPSWPSQAWDDFRYGLHLRYPAEWESRSQGTLPPGVPGSAILAVGPPGEEAFLSVYYVGVLVHRAGIEAMARRSAELSGTEVVESGWKPYARREAFHVRSESGELVEELTFFSYRRVLFAVRAVARRDAAPLMETMREVAGGLRLG